MGPCGGLASFIFEFLSSARDTDGFHIPVLVNDSISFNKYMRFLLPNRKFSSIVRSSSPRTKDLSDDMSFWVEEGCLATDFLFLEDELLINSLSKLKSRAV